MQDMQSMQDTQTIPTHENTQESTPTNPQDIIDNTQDKPQETQATSTHKVQETQETSAHVPCKDTRDKTDVALVNMRKAHVTPKCKARYKDGRPCKMSCLRVSPKTTSTYKHAGRVEYTDHCRIHGGKQERDARLRKIASAPTARAFTPSAQPKATNAQRPTESHASHAQTSLRPRATSASTVNTNPKGGGVVAENTHTPIPLPTQPSRETPGVPLSEHLSKITKHKKPTTTDPRIVALEAECKRLKEHTSWDTDAKLRKEWRDNTKLLADLKAQAKDAATIDMTEADFDSRMRVVADCIVSGVKKGHADKWSPDKTIAFIFDNVSRNVHAIYESLKQGA